MLYTVEEIAKELKVSEKTVRHWLNQGKLKGFKLPNNKWRVKQEDLKSFINGGSDENEDGEV